MTVILNRVGLFRCVVSTSNIYRLLMELQVLVEQKSGGRIFTLNRPKQLNALSGVMVCLR